MKKELISFNLKIELLQREALIRRKIFLKANPKGEFEKEEMYKKRIEKLEDDKTSDIIERLESNLNGKRILLGQIKENTRNFELALEEEKILDSDNIGILYDAEKEMATIIISNHPESASILSGRTRGFPIGLRMDRGRFNHVDFQYTSSVSIPIKISEEIISNLREGNHKKAFISCSFSCKAIISSGVPFRFDVSFINGKINYPTLNKTFKIGK